MSALSGLLTARDAKTEEYSAAIQKCQSIKAEIDDIDVKITEILKHVPDHTYITVEGILHRVRRNSFNMIVLERITVTAY